MFLKWGRVIDVFIPNKRDKFRKKFGFVCFLDVQNPKALEDKLDTPWLGTYKLCVNFPVFQRGLEDRPKQQVLFGAEVLSQLGGIYLDLPDKLIDNCSHIKGADGVVWNSVSQKKI